MKKICTITAVTAACAILTAASGNDSAAAGNNGKNFSIMAVFMLLILLRGWRINAKTRKREQEYNKRYRELAKKYPREDERDHDVYGDDDKDDDYPSGFGGNFVIITKNADGEKTAIKPFVALKKTIRR